MKKIRFTDWNTVLGTGVFTILACTLSIFAFVSPETFFEDRRLSSYLIPFVGPLTAAIAVFRMVIFVEFGDGIAFRRIFGTRSYSWEHITRLELVDAPKSVLFGLVRWKTEFLIFEIEQPGHHEQHGYRVSKKHRDAIHAIMKIVRPDLMGS